ncbi:transcription initiation factor TFIID subunit 3 isoform X2 [Bactrocera neohumeralis]|uniref:transcription initiation factor TFIID subunit 3 isoform X2 n=1 Tax=Bactrocera neohumeralis TaxID=98809 RepID=UPI0021650381|nr:transcription initiation factor TFIID subunit 3 isoform X2 [Bactrocera neohumeralis]
MTDHYMRELLRIVVAQICQTIGYHVVQTTPFELLQDILQRFLHEFSRDLRRQVEHYNRTEACLDDIHITLGNLNINISELLDYTNNVEPVPLAVELPKFPAHKNTNLNFLKPGSKEVLTRPVHIHEYLPPMLPADSQSTLPSHYLSSDAPFFKSSSINVSNDCETKTERYLPTFANTVTCLSTPNRLGVSKDSLDPSQEGAKVTVCSSSHMFDEEGRPTREISSVVMTTGGFISPAIEGKLPDTKVPKFVEKLMGFDAPPPSLPAAVVSSEKFKTADHKHHSNNTTPKPGVSEAVHTCSIQSKPLLNVEKTELADGPASQLLATSSKLMIPNENVSDITNISITKKVGWSPLTRHVQVPTIATKLLNKAKKKSPLDLQSALMAKTYLPNAESSNTSLISPRVENSERLNKKTKKMLQNLLKPGLESSSTSSDYSNSVLQRHKMEKYLKKQSKHKKKILQKQGDVLKNLEITKVLGDKLPVPQPSSTKTFSDISVIKDSFLPEASKEKTCVPKASLSFSQCSTTDNSFSVKNNENTVDNVKLSPNATFLEKKMLSGVKLSTELDKNKLNIFKKISKQKSQKPASPNSRVPSTQLSGGSDGQFINLPCGTTITPTPTNLKCMIASDTNMHNSDQLEKKLNVSVNCERGVAGLVENISANNITDVIIPNQISQLPLQIGEGARPKKRGRKPGSKNLPKQTIVSPIGSNDVSHTKKMKKFKISKYDQQYPPHLETKISMELTNPVDNMTPTLCCGSDAITSSLSLNIKDIRKERKKTKTKNLILNMSMTEPNEYNAETVFPTKEEVNTINKKLMRMDTILQPLGSFNDAMVDPNSDNVQTSSHKPLPYKSPTNRKRLSPQIPLQLHTIPSVVPGAHQSFMPKPVMGGIPDLLKFCPFPSGPGLIPHTAQNMLFPRLPPTFHLPISNLRQQSAAKPINIESSISGTSLEPTLFQASGERNYCNVPPFVPESMKLTSPDVISEMRKAERECPKTPKLQHSTTVSENILNTPELWSTPETGSKSVPPTPGGMSLNTYELHLQNDRATKSPKSNADNPVFIGSMYSKHASSSIDLAKSSAVTSILNTDDPIELSDDSIEYSTIMLNSLSSTNSKDLHQNQLQLPTKSLNFSQIEDYVPIRKDITKKLSGDLYLSSKDPKMFQKANKLLKTTKNFLPTEPENLSQIDIFSSEKHGVGKLAGGADLIPLISTGSAYSAKTIPSTSLTATVAAPFTLSKKDIYSTNAFENSLLSTNITDNEFLCVNNELQRKKKDHKKLKKLRDDKTKKKKDKKSKCKERTDHHENVVNRNEKSHKEKLKDSLRCDEEQQLVNKDLLKKLKKEKKKKNKQLFTEELAQTVKKHATDTPGISGVGKPTTMFSMFSTSTNLSATTNLSSSTQSFVPKLTLKLGNSQSPTPDEDTSQKKYFSASKTLNEFERKREPSPELARISPLVTRPQKQKFNLAETLISASNQITASGGSGNSAFDSIIENNVNTVSASKNPCVHSGAPSPSPWSSGGTLSASSVLLPQQLLHPLKSQEPSSLSSKVDGGLLPNSNINTSRFFDVAARHSPVPLISETSRPSSYIDAEGNRVWICPACGKVDDGSPMIGCDGCDAWYHWICVGITIAPKDNEDWFCRVCITRKKGIHATDKKRKRSKKK